MTIQSPKYDAMCDEKQLVMERANVSINAKDLWELLQVVIGTEEHVRALREYLELYLQIMRAKKSINQHHYFSGSRGEGFQFSWSDLDILHSLKFDYVAMDTCYGSVQNECNLIAIQKNCQPGYCFLFFKKRRGSTVLGYEYMKRLEFLEMFTDYSCSHNYINGPCISLKYPNQTDRCTAFPIHPEFSNEILKSFITKFWNNVKSAIINESIPVMHVVAKGPEKGDGEGLQWMISFSVLEQYIVHSLNHVQFCCYGLMKILQHNIVDSSPDTNDTLSSYHIKTVLFHVLEDIHSDFWIPQNIFYCFRICFTRLLLFMVKGNCPNYFRPECNLLSKLKIIEKRGEIVKKLFRIFRKEILDICFTTSLYSNKRLFIPKQMRANLTDDGCRKSIECILDVIKKISNMPQNISPLRPLHSVLEVLPGYQHEYHECIDCILMIMHLFRDEENDLKSVFLRFVFLLFMRRIGVIMYDKFLLTGRKCYLLSAEVAFILVQNVGASGSVYLATLWFCERKFIRSINLLIEVIVKISDSSYNFFSELKNSDCDFMRCLSLAYPYKIILYRLSKFFPNDLKEEVRNSVVDYTVFDLSYVYFLLFLCYYELNDIFMCMVCIDRIQMSYNEYCFEILNEGTRHDSKRLHQIAQNKMKLRAQKS